MELDFEINSSLSPCSIGNQLNDVCHKTSYTKRKGLCSFSSYSCDIQEILQLRTECKDIQNVCYHHEQVYMSKYSHLFGQTCCDPLERQCSAKKSLRPITIERVRNSNRKLLPGRKLCRQCEKMLEASEEIANNEEDHSDLYIPIEEKEDVLNKSFNILGESPIKKKKLSAQKCVSYGKQKVEKVSTYVKTMIASVLEVDEVDLSENKCTNCKVQHEDSVDLHEILSALKQKFETESTSVSEKLQILTIIPQNWTIEKTCKFFHTTEHMVKKARRLRKEKGPLGVPGPKKASSTIPEHVVKDVLEFYESTDVSRICPGKNDYISVRQPGQSKQAKQKHLILCNLKEAYTLFKQECPNHKIGFSKFADLRPKWCVLAGSTGTHSVCVCMIHQNVKLMMASLKQSGKLSISDFLSHYVCDINNEACMLGLCSHCPLQTAFEEFVGMLMDDYDEESEVTFRQWITTDR